MRYYKEVALIRRKKVGQSDESAIGQKKGETFRKLHGKI